MDNVKLIVCYLLINDELVKVSDVTWDEVINTLNYSFYLDTIKSPDPEENDFTDWFMRKNVFDLPKFFGRVEFLH